MAAERIKMLLAGAGFMGRVHLTETAGLDTVEYVGVVDRDASAGASLADDFGLPSFTDVAEAARECRPDAVDVCVPTPAHLPVIRVCADAGLHALCEKPMARDPATTLQIRDVAAEANIRLMIAQVIRFWPEYAKAAELLRSGRYGNLTALDCRRLSAPPDWNTWIMRGDLGGGAVVDLQIHDMDFVIDLLGPPGSIMARGREAQGAVNAVHSELRFTDDFAVHLDASFLMPVSYPFRMFFSMELEEAVLEMDFWRRKGERLKVFPREGEAFSPELSGEDAYGAEIAYFADCLLKGREFDRVPLESSIQALQWCLAAETSCREHRPVEVPA